MPNLLKAPNIFAHDSSFQATNWILSILNGSIMFFTESFGNDKNLSYRSFSVDIIVILVPDSIYKLYDDFLVPIHFT